MSIGDIAVGLVAFIALAFLALIVLNKLIALIKNWREIAEVTGWVALILGGGGLLIVGAFFAVVFIENELVLCTRKAGRDVETVQRKLRCDVYRNVQVAHLKLSHSSVHWR